MYTGNIRLIESGKSYLKKIMPELIEALGGKEEVEKLEAEIKRYMAMNDGELTDLATMKWMREHPDKAHQVLKYLLPATKK